jgi:hypothetical protein
MADKQSKEHEMTTGTIHEGRPMRIMEDGEKEYLLPGLLIEDRHGERRWAKKVTVTATWEDAGGATLTKEWVDEDLSWPTDEPLTDDEAFIPPDLACENLWQIGPISAGKDEAKRFNVAWRTPATAEKA